MPSSSLCNSCKHYVNYVPHIDTDIFSGRQASIAEYCKLGMNMIKTRTFPVPEDGDCPMYTIIKNQPELTE